MSVIVSSTVSQKPAVESDKPTLTPEQVIEQVRALREQIPEFVSEPNGRELRKLREAARVDIQLTREAVNVVAEASEVQNWVGSTPEQLRESESEWSRWVSAEGELRSLVRGVSAANDIRRYRLALSVRQAYEMSRTLAKRDAYSSLLPHVEAMFRVKNRKSRKPALPPEPQPPSTKQ